MLMRFRGGKREACLFLPFCGFDKGICFVDFQRILDFNACVDLETKLGNEYYQYALPIVRLQLARAGVRVAAMLNQIFR